MDKDALAYLEYEEDFDEFIEYFNSKQYKVDHLDRCFELVAGDE